MVQENLHSRISNRAPTVCLLPAMVLSNRTTANASMERRDPSLLFPQARRRKTSLFISLRQEASAAPCGIAPDSPWLALRYFCYVLRTTRPDPELFNPRAADERTIEGNTARIL